MNDKILECNYIESYVGSWTDQKQKILEKYIKKGYNKNNIKITRVKTDTKGLRCYVVKEIQKWLNLMKVQF